MDGEPLWPWEVKHRCHRRWRLAPKHSGAWTAYVSVGQLADGRWYVAVVSRVNRPLQLAAGEREAYAEAERWRYHISLEHGYQDAGQCSVLQGGGEGPCSD